MLCEDQPSKLSKWGDSIHRESAHNHFLFQGLGVGALWKVVSSSPHRFALLTRYRSKDVCERSHNIYAQSQFRFPLVNLTLCFIKRTLSSGSGGVKGWDTPGLIGLRLLIVSREPGIRYARTGEVERMSGIIRRRGLCVLGISEICDVQVKLA